MISNEYEPGGAATGHMYESNHVMTSPTVIDMPSQSDTVCLTKKRSYKVSATLGYNLTHMPYTQAVLDTGAGPNLVHSRILPQGWQSKLEPYVSTTKIVDASNRTMQPIGILNLWLRLGQFQARIRFLFHQQYGHHLHTWYVLYRPVRESDLTRSPEACIILFPFDCDSWIAIADNIR